MSHDIVIVGLGPGDPGLLTREAWQVLSGADTVWLRTRQHPTVAGLPDGPVYHSFDALYETHDSFAALYSAIVDEVLNLARHGQGVVYAVPGHALVGEVTVHQLLQRAENEGLSTRVVTGVSFIEPLLTALRVDPFDTGLQIVDAYDLAAQHHPILCVDLPLMVPQVANRRLVSDVKLTLLNAYPAQHTITVVTGAGTAEFHVHTVPLSEVDHATTDRPLFDDRTTLYVPPLPEAGSVAAYHEIIAHLRSPEGCPWDREQTHASLRTNLLEEAYEVLHAIDAGDMGELREELGDLLMQVLFHTQIAAEGGSFTLSQVVVGSMQKLVRRHPHVFGDVEASDSEAVLRNWEQLKAQERGESAGERGPFEGVPEMLPALARGQEIQSRAARFGFDWPAVDGVWDKIEEELGELRLAEQHHEELELGDVLFSLVNLARWLGVDAESALRAANRRFVQRFAAMQRLAEKRGPAFEELTLGEMDALWSEAKGETRDAKRET
jgi:tetrapyrrole methylase family protein/MazG family protein